ncbi:MAG: ABC transporter ATP-binding protein/permease [Tyzzerella sp.]|nr:ABC transporter ATP-binding protein/permease [Tyzzerella sp.]
MMIDKRLIGKVEESKKYIAGNVLVQWISLLANIVMMFVITRLLAGLYYETASKSDMLQTLLISLVVVVIRFVCAIAASKMSYLSSKAVKKKLREMIYEKLLKLGASYHTKVNTSEIVQLAVEGVDQLETYFGAYLPQFFYAMIAPLTLFVVLSFVNMTAAVMLLICVPLIPVAIAAVQTWAKKLLSKYWGQYTALGDTFLENLQGLTTLKIYQSDAYKNEQMNEESEKFRKITMKVLTMQLNSITIMDLIAYGGAALGVIIAVQKFAAGEVTLAGSLLIILLAADFFIPMRMLGSFFHIAMNGMAASGKIFKLLDLQENPQGEREFPEHGDIQMREVRFSYEEEREILKGIDMTFAERSFTAIVGESGCGKSTIASLLMTKNSGYQGSIRVGETELSEISEESLMKHVTYISHNSYLFKGSVRENLLLAKPDADDARLWEVLEQTNLAEFLRGENGLETEVLEKGANLSGGQCQRLALARAILHDTPIYIFDEATSNIDVESENDIIQRIYELAERKTIILISHRLANVVKSDRIYVLKDGVVTEEGTHAQLLEKDGHYAGLWNAQQSLENFGTKEQSAKTNSDEKIETEQAVDKHSTEKNFDEEHRKEAAHEEKN